MKHVCMCFILNHVHSMDVEHKTHAYMFFICIIFCFKLASSAFSENLLKCSNYFFMHNYPCIFGKTINIHFNECDNARILCNAHFGNENLLIYHYEFHTA